jgi:8-oxo-dGTP pyrophosphatase MutT (NUDIX family)
LSGAAEAHVVPVFAAVIRRGGRYLVGRRPPAKRHGGLWEFPGGKVLDGESRLDAAGRELDEELGLEVVSLGALLFSVEDAGSPFVIEFFETAAAGTPRAIEHSEIGWFTVAELARMDLAPADARFVRLLSANVLDRPGRASLRPERAE